LLLCLGMIGFVALSPSLRAAEQETKTSPILVLRVKSIDNVLSDLKYVLNSAGQEQQVKEFEDQLNKALPKGFEGIDTKQPFGLYGKIEENLMESSVVALIPTTDEQALIAFAERLSGLKSKKEGDVYSFASEKLPVPIYVRFANQYAYVTVK